MRRGRTAEAIGPAAARALLASLVLGGLGGCALSHRGPREDAVTGDCPSAVLATAPAPVPGYCPTRDNRSAFEAPAEAPELAWELALPVEVPRWAPIVVGPRGRLLLGAGSELVAVDDRGGSARVAFRADLGGALSAPLLLADGRVFLTRRVDVRSLDALWLDPGRGEVVRREPLPEGAQGLAAVGPTGTFYLHAREGDASRLLGWRPGDGVLWRGALLATSWPDVALAHDDRLIVQDPVRRGDAVEARLTCLDGPTGETLWSASLDRDAPIVRGPAVGADGAIHVVLWTDATATTTLVTLERDGRERRRVMLPEPPWGGGTGALSVGTDGSVFVKEGRRLMALDPEGELVWERETHPNIDIGGALDAAGRILVGSGASSAVDAADGTLLWESAIPAHEEPTPGGGLFIAFPGPPVVGDGVVYYLADDGLLQAARAP